MKELLDKYFEYCREVDRAIKEETNIDNFPAVLARSFLKQKGIYHKIWNNNTDINATVLNKKVEDYTYSKLKSLERSWKKWIDMIKKFWD